MSTVLLVQLDAGLASALQKSGPNVAGARFEVASSPDSVPDRVKRRGIDAMVLGASLSDPVRVAQCALSYDADLSVLILAEPQRLETLTDQLRFSPLLSGDIACRPNSDPWEVLREVSTAVEHTRRRRRHRETLEAVNLQLSSLPPPQASELQSLGRILDLARLGVSAVDAEGRVISWNRRAERLFGRDESTMVGRPFSDLLPPPARADWEALLQRSPHLEAPHRIQVEHADDSDEPRHLELTAAPLQGSDGAAGLMLLFEDITERLRVEEERQELLHQTQSALAVRDAFLSVASHELRTPLTSLRLVVQALGRELDEASGALAKERLRRKVETADRQLVRLSRLVEGLLDVSSVQSGRLRLERSEVDLAHVVTTCLGELREDFTRQGCMIEAKLQPGLVGEWDERRLEQVVSHLLMNALRYGPGHPIQVDVHAKGHRAVLEVRDRGVGIAPADLERIFERFERASSTRNYGGLGIGLYISRKIVEAHGGEISASSAPGEGAAFRIMLPRG